MPISLGIWDRLPSTAQMKLRRLLQPAWFGSLRRTSPLSNRWGIDRGKPIDRYYIEQFLQQQCKDIRGRVLEVGNRIYTDRFGSDVDQIDVLDNIPENPHATLFIDLEAAQALSS